MLFNTIIRVNFVHQIFVLEIFIFRSYQPRTIYSLYRYSSLCAKFNNKIFANYGIKGTCHPYCMNAHVTLIHNSWSAIKRIKILVLFRTFPSTYMLQWRVAPNCQPRSLCRKLPVRKYHTRTQQSHALTAANYYDSYMYMYIIMFKLHTCMHCQQKIW
jgi:hypothetical protein